jgi:hypothetical protein
MDLLIQSISDDNLSHSNHVLVLAGDHQRHDLSQAGNREPLFLFLQLQLLQSVDPAGLVASRSEDDTVRPFLDMIQSSIAVDRST